MAIIDVRDVVQRLNIRVARQSFDELIISCPLHQDKRPSASINIEKQLFNCFVCGGMSLRNLVKMLLGVSSDDAEKFMYLSSGVIDVDHLVQRLHESLDDAAEDEIVDEDVLNEMMPYHEYLEKRGITQKEAAQWQTRFDKISERIAFPIRDGGGFLRGVWGRTVREDTQENPKYMAIIRCHAHRYLFGEHNLDDMDTRIIVEGPFAVIKLRRLGYPAVAPMTSKLSNKQAAYLASFTNLFIAFDNDNAGKKGVMSSLQFLPHARIVEWPSDVDALKPSVIDKAIKHAVSTIAWTLKMKEGAS